jgi:mannose-6-phosphate isomerase-like protein (cupin superfamily)
LLELPVGRELGECFASRKGLLMVSFGKVEVEVEGRNRVLYEGESCAVGSGERFRLKAPEWSDVLFFEELGGRTK